MDCRLIETTVPVTMKRVYCIALKIYHLYSVPLGKEVAKFNYINLFDNIRVGDVSAQALCTHIRF